MEVIEIYAEIPKRLYGEIEDWGNIFDLPDGVIMSRKKGSRSCYFTCEGANEEAVLIVKNYLIDILDQKGISWQES